MEAQSFLKSINDAGIDFFTGVPDSLLAPFVDLLVSSYGYNNNHIVGVNEGACVGMAAGYHLATGKVPCVYMQNSGIGNAVNPIASLINDKVYGIPMLFVVGYRGEPNVHDEPQHIFQGEITLKQLSLLQLETFVLDSSITQEELAGVFANFLKVFSSGKSCAIVVKKGAIKSTECVVYKNDYSITREKAIERIVECADSQSVFVSSTGKISRELFEIREQKSMRHKYDFLTVGSMGHAISIAGIIAKYNPKSQVICLDGDGAMLMHMGATATIGSLKLNNLVHIVLDNNAHETVGGVKTASDNVDLINIAKSCGYQLVSSVDKLEELERIIKNSAKENKSMFIRVAVALGSRSDLGRPTTTAKENKQNFMDCLTELK